MSQLGRLQKIISAPATQFIAASVQNAMDTATVLAPGLGDTGRARVVRVILRAAEAKDYEVHFYGSSAFNSATLALNRYLGRVNFLVADGVRVAGAGFFLYSIACDIPVYRDDRGLPAVMYVGIINRSAVALVGGASTLALELLVDETGGF